MTSTDKILVVLREEETSLLAAIPADVQVKIEAVSVLRKQYTEARKAVAAHRSAVRSLALVRKTIERYTPKTTSAAPDAPAPAPTKRSKKAAIVAATA
jgi:hypothetical protein